MRSHTIRHRQRRGSVIVLVVAVLALLAVIGTVYIVSSRAERSSASASSVAVNLDLAQKGVEQMAISQIASAPIDSAGVVGGNENLGQLGFHASRKWDIPEINRALNADPSNANYILPTLPTAHIIGQSDHNPTHKDQAWLVSSTYVPNGGENYLDATSWFNRYNQMSLLTSAAFNPSTGAFDLPFYKTAPFASTGWNDLKQNYMNFFEVVAPNLSSVAVPLPQGGFVPAGPDAFIQLLPFSESSGIRYRFGVRIIDTSRMANLNVGETYNYSVPADLTSARLNGTFLTGYNLCSPALFNNGAATRDVYGNVQTFIGGNDQTTSLQLVGAIGNPANPGRLGSWTLSAGPREYSWQQAAFRFENNTLGTTPFDLADEIELRIYGALGTNYTSRAALNFGARVWPNMLGNRDPNSQNVVGNWQRQFYTTYSSSRDLRPFADPLVLSPPGIEYQIGGLTLPIPTPSVWPPFPAKVSAAPDIANHVSAFNGLTEIGAADYLAIAATNIATAMKYCDYSDAEVRAFAVNYLSYRWSGWTSKSMDHNGSPMIAYTAPAGPSFMDDQGLCARYVLADGVTPSGRNYVSPNLRSGAAGKVYVAYLAQPFLNEVAETQSSDATVVTVSRSAIELYNPYSVALDLEGYKIRVGTTEIDLSGEHVAPRGYFVLHSGGYVAEIDANASQKTDATLSLFGANHVYLLRKYTDRTGAAAWAAVDDYDITDITSKQAVAGPVGDTNYHALRGNDDPLISPANWAATIASPDSLTAVAAVPTTLGKINPPPVPPAGVVSVPLYDRYVEDTTNTIRATPLLNIGEFNRVMRVAHQANAASSGEPMDDGALSKQLDARFTASATDALLKDTQLPQEATVHFDFRAVPAMYLGTTTNLANGAKAPLLDPLYSTEPKRGDTRAANLLDMLTFTDRVSDYAVNILDNDPVNRGISKIRIPGQININTASAEVLTSIPSLQANQQYIRLILAYRWRTSTADPRIPTGLPAIVPNINFAAGYAGYGIRSMAELQVPFRAYDLNAATVRKTLDDRDQLWASFYNYLTVRSDTFVMYAYIEAVRQNPRYSGPFDNKFDWYLPASGLGTGVSDDPNNTTLPLQRVGRRRWVSIIDRSGANANRLITNGTQPNPLYTDPRIVATKDLPQ